MIKSTGHADLPLHIGTVPRWLADRMRDLGTLIVESLILNYDKKEVAVCSEEVTDPRQIRYAWTNFGQVTLFGSNDLPVAPFRAVIA